MSGIRRYLCMRCVLRNNEDNAMDSILYTRSYLNITESSYHPIILFYNLQREGRKIYRCNNNRGYKVCAF